ncbi:MAG: 2-hydroxyacyl-CoA dehydratase [Dehalococcoidia bacterium]|nr:2-hydroxyacyl-CoA dehydratase [Dehalococcoidia bacterium]
MDTRTRPRSLQAFRDAAATLVNPAMQEWKKQGGRIVGYFCSGVPEELLLAGGFLPFRMRATGSTSTELSDAYYSSINCSFPRHCFNLALMGSFDFLDGIVCLNSCDHVRRLYDNWKRFVKPLYLEMMSLPRKTEAPQVEWYRDEINNLRRSLEDYFQITIADSQIREAIKQRNEIRGLQRQLYGLRKSSNPPISGSDALAVVVAGTALPRDRYLEYLRDLVNELGPMRGNGDYRARIMIVGGILDDPAYIDVIEEQGGLVVTDSLCFGARTLWKDVDESIADPVTALAQYYVADRLSCPRTYGDHERRSEFILNMVREFKVDGIIGERLLFCDQWLGENIMLNHDFKDAGIPFLELDREYTLGGVGQLRTRVQAFLETIER